MKKQRLIHRHEPIGICAECRRAGLLAGARVARKLWFEFTLPSARAEGYNDVCLEIARELRRAANGSPNQKVGIPCCPSGSSGGEHNSDCPRKPWGSPGRERRLANARRVK